MFEKIISYFQGEKRKKESERWADTPYLSSKDGYASPQMVELLIFAQTRQRALVKQMMQGVIYGGPGYSKMTAWGITISNGNAVECEYKMLNELFETLYFPVDGKIKEIDVEPLTQQLRSEDGHHYDVHKIRLHIKNKTYLVEQWFDITKYFNSQK